MKILLLKDASGVGRKGEIKEVNDGYAKNFLIAKGFATQATEKVLQANANSQKQKEESQKKLEQRFLYLKSELDKRTFTFEVKANEKGQVFGSISEKDIISRISEKMNFEVEKSQISMPKHLKELGEYEIEVKFSGKVVAKPHIKLTAKQ